MVNEILEQKLNGGATLAVDSTGKNAILTFEYSGRKINCVIPDRIEYRFRKDNLTDFEKKGLKMPSVGQAIALADIVLQNRQNPYFGNLLQAMTNNPDGMDLSTEVQWGESGFNIYERGKNNVRTVPYNIVSKSMNLQDVEHADSGNQYLGTVRENSYVMALTNGLDFDVLSRVAKNISRSMKFDSDKELVFFEGNVYQKNDSKINFTSIRFGGKISMYLVKYDNYGLGYSIGIMDDETKGGN
jgi:hypothetical protein